MKSVRDLLYLSDLEAMELADMPRARVRELVEMASRFVCPSERTVMQVTELHGSVLVMLLSNAFPLLVPWSLSL